MLQEDASTPPPVSEKRQTPWFVGLLKREAQGFFENPFGYAIERFFYCLMLGIGISILAVGIRFVIQAVVESVS
ncbi:MAG: hypothetical protein RL326_555 [Pseudomonadota bacterium]|jgi:hypothetical protein